MASSFQTYIGHEIVVPVGVKPHGKGIVTDSFSFEGILVSVDDSFLFLVEPCQPTLPPGTRYNYRLVHINSINGPITMKKRNSAVHIDSINGPITMKKRNSANSSTPAALTMDYVHPCLHPDTVTSTVAAGKSIVLDQGAVDRKLHSVAKTRAAACLLAATVGAQDLFDAISRLIKVRWQDDDCMVIDESIKLREPYTAADLEPLDPSTRGSAPVTARLAYLRRVLNGERQSLGLPLAVPSPHRKVDPLAEL